MKDWSNLGIVETIFEEENEDLQSLISSSSSSLPLSPPLSSPCSPLQSVVDAWTSSTKRKPDVKIHVQGMCFYLHKEPLIMESSYLKRHLIKLSEFILPPSMKITADTFKQVADFCYCGHAVLTPFNIAAITTAAELLGMNGDNDTLSLRQKTEYYFCMVVAVNRDFACSVFRSCLSLLPEVEQTAFLASRCIEALVSIDDEDDNDSVVSCADELKRVAPEDFRVIGESMHRRFTRSHDLIYRVVDLYFLVYNGGKITEEQKTQICSCIDCSILSSSLLMHAVQNPRMPLRFIVQAMLIEQLNTHRTLFTTLNTTNRPQPQPVPQPQLEPDVRSNESPATLGAILERDAALRQVDQLRHALNTTSSRIETLEHELSGMKQVLAAETEKTKHNKSLLVLEQQPAGRSSSCRFISTSNNKVERGERGSVSTSILRFSDGKIMGTSSSSSSSNLKKNHLVQSPKAKNVKKNFGQRLILGLKTAFGVSNNNKIKEVKEVNKRLAPLSYDDGGLRAMLKALPNGDLN